MQTGGKLLGQGVFGCTFDPAPRCADGQEFKTISGLPAVGKITDEDSSQELAIGKAIMALPRAADYFALPTESCDPAMPVRDPDIYRCKIIEKTDDFSMLVMPMAGRQLAKYGADLQHLAKTYKRIFIHMLEGAVIYQNAGYVHNDIHMGNVLVDAKDVARYIDVGAAFKVDDIKSWRDARLGTEFRSALLWQPPEVHGWRMVMSDVSIGRGVKKLKEVNPEYAMLEHQYHRSLYHDVARFMSSIRLNDEVGFIKVYGKRFDSWRIGICMWMLWDDMLRWTGFMDTPLYEERHLIRKVLHGMTEFDPRNRLTVGQALATLTS